MVVPTFIIDIAPDSRVQTGSLNDLVVGDQLINVVFKDGLLAWPIPGGSTWNLCLVDREVATNALVESSTASVIAANKIQFAIDTGENDVLTCLAGARSKQLIAEVNRTDAGEVQTLARWMLTIWNLGYVTP